MKTDNFKKSTVLILFIILGLSGCNDNTVDTGSTDENTDTGKVRFIHSASSAKGLDLSYMDLYDGNYYVFEYSTTYSHQYGYYDFLVGERRLAAFLASTSIVVATADFTLAKDEKYTLIAHDYEATLDPDFLVLSDTTAVPDSAKAFIRFVHLSTDAPEIEITDTQSATVVADLSHLEKSAYLTINAGTYTYVINDKSTKNEILSLSPTTFLSKQVYTIVLSGTVSELTTVDFNAEVYRETSL